MRRAGRPSGSDHPGQQGSLLLQRELHHTRLLKLLPDPLALLQVIDEHEFHPDVLAVRHLGGRRGELHMSYILWF